MELLADSHVVLWALSGQRMSVDATDALTDPQNVVHVSAASVWELNTKRALGKLRFDGDLAQEIRDVGFDELALRWAHAERSLTLPLHHRDPFDRMLIAQALVEGLTLVTRDRAFRCLRRAPPACLTAASCARTGADRAARGSIMEYRRLGTTGVRVSPLCLGAMMFGQWGNPDHDESVAVIHAALDAGINFVDTADVYSAGESEEIVGRALEGRRDDVVLATKLHGSMGRDPNHAGNSRRWIVRACEDSLRRLRTDRIDLYQVHRPEPGTDIDETLAALSDLVHAGKVLYLGSSTFPASEIVEAQWTAQRRGRERFVCEQPPYSMLVRGIEADVLPACQRHGMGVIPWGPLGGGWLSGKWRKGATEMTSRRAQRLPLRYDLSIPANQRKLDAADALHEVADEAGLSLVHLALAFVLSHPAISAAIIGPRTMEQLKSQLDAADVTLDPAILDRIDEIVPPGTNFSNNDSGYLPPALADPRQRRRN